MSAPPTVTTRRVPPPCWSHDETLALINAYAARWLSLNRGNLRTSDWDAVSTAVSASNLGAPKSSIQCRHKIEKLRKRYRSEKQRSHAVPGRFISSWDLFPLLDSMNFGGSSSAAAFSNRDRDVFDQKIVDGDRFRLKKSVNEKKSMSNYGKIDCDMNQAFCFNRDLGRVFLRSHGKIDFDDDFGGGVGLKMLNGCNMVNSESMTQDCLEIEGDLRSNIGFDHDFRAGFVVKMQGDRDFVAHRLKSYRKIDDHHNIDEFPVETLGDSFLVSSPGYKPKNYSKIDGNFNIGSYPDHDADYGTGNGSEFLAETFHDGDFVPLGHRLRNFGRIDRNLNANIDFHLMNEYGSSSRMMFEKKRGGVGVKRGLNPVEELVSSITLLTERFLKTEKLKMEMARETQKMQMETERKHSQMMLESQQYILDAFVTGLLEKKKEKKKNKKVKVEIVSPNRLGNGDEV